MAPRTSLDLVAGFTYISPVHKGFYGREGFQMAADDVYPALVRTNTDILTTGQNLDETAVRNNIVVDYKGISSMKRLTSSQISSTLVDLDGQPLDLTALLVESPVDYRRVLEFEGAQGLMRDSRNFQKLLDKNGYTWKVSKD